MIAGFSLSYFKNWTDAVYFDRGEGTATSYGLLSEGERRQIRERWNDLVSAWRTYRERCSWLAENEGHSEWSVRDEKTANLGRKIGKMRDDLATYLGCSPVLICERMAELDEAGSDDEN